MISCQALIKNKITVPNFELVFPSQMNKTSVSRSFLDGVLIQSCSSFYSNRMKQVS